MINNALMEKGLDVFVGSEFNIRVAKSKDIKDVIDFEDPGKVELKLPTDFSVKKEVEIIDQPRIGLPTNVKILGKTQITGDMGDISTPNGIPWYASMCLGGVVRSVENDNALISIEYDGSFILDIERGGGGETSKVDFVFSDTRTESVNVPSNMTVSEFVDKVNEIDGLFCVLHIGDGKEVLNFETGTDEYNTHIIGFYRTGALSEDYKRETAPFIHYIVPRRGDPMYFNILASSKRAPANYLYSGCRLLSFNMTYQNNNLTNTTVNIWAGFCDEFTGTPTQANVDDISTAYAQTNGRTKVYSSGMEAMVVASLTNNFQWVVEPSWNISNEPYNIPVLKYTDSFDLEMMFNEQSKSIFEKRVLEGKNISVMIHTRGFTGGKRYDLIKSAKTLLGQPQFPTIADGVIQLQASGFTAVANIYDPFTSMFIMTSDRKLDVTYTEDEIKSDFPDYIK